MFGKEETHFAADRIQKISVRKPLIRLCNTEVLYDSFLLCCKNILLTCR